MLSGVMWRFINLFMSYADEPKPNLRPPFTKKVNQIAPIDFTKGERYEYNRNDIQNSEACEDDASIQAINSFQQGFQGIHLPNLRKFV